METESEWRRDERRLSSVAAVAWGRESTWTMCSQVWTIDLIKEVFPEAIEAVLNTGSLWY